MSWKTLILGVVVDSGMANTLSNAKRQSFSDSKRMPRR